LVYADDINLLGGNTNTKKKENTETLLGGSTDGALEINAEKAKYVIMSRYQNSGLSQNIKIGNKSFEKLAKLKYLRAILTH
jgi:hypothetical protein